MSDAKTATEELNALAHGLAYDHAATLIASACTEYGDGYDLQNVDGLARQQVTGCVKYLDMRGLLERDQFNSNVAFIREESEATA